MKDKILLTFILTDLLFLGTGGLLIGFSLITEAEKTNTPTVSTIARNLLLAMCPLTGAVANAIIIFVTFLASLPAIIMPMTRGWLKLHGYMVVICGVFTLIIGLDIWFTTLKTRSELSTVWSTQSAADQSLLQQELSCCGYFNSTSPPFVTDSVCADALTAAQKPGCVSPFSSFANNFLDLIFTAAFGIVGVDVSLVLSIAMLLKDRKEKERYRHIDEKTGTAGF